ncbi:MULTISPECIES: hypothetical protein [unclassified Sphingomonas]|uniref:hypothetical protein n=1 Tax=unclassified Sphingomonas TaxID=196159 RepID=UPI000829B010|nr:MULTISPECIES: hypothetical protein [unclassified Sphingomonas]
MGISDPRPLHWWQTRWFVVLAAIVAAIPLVWPDIPPLVDLPGHMGRYRVQQAWDAAPHLHEWYRFEWALIGNLGLDLLMVVLEPLIGLEPAVKLVVLTIPPLTVLGLLWIAREVHGRIPATALFALPLAYSFPFHFGFVNFALSMALALNAFALWLRLARLEQTRLRAVVFVPIGLVIWVTHTFGWGTLGLLAFSAELIRQHDKRGGWIAPWFHAGLHCIALLPPAILMLAWRASGDAAGQTGDWFDWRLKMQWVTMVLRDRWQLFDLASVGILYLILFKGFRDPNIQYSRHLSASVVFLLAIFILLPRVVFGSAYADMRLAPYLFAIALIALRPKPGLTIRGATLLAAAGLAFFGARIAGTTYSFWLYDRDYDRELAALDRLPMQSRLVTFVGETCFNEWRMTRLEHLPGIALARRLAYANDQWSMAGGQLLTTRYKIAGRFAHDPSELVTDVQCPRQYWRPVARALTRFPREAFDHVWMIQPPPYDERLHQGLQPLWRNGRSGLYRVDPRIPPAELRPEDTPRHWLMRTS